MMAMVLVVLPPLAPPWAAFSGGVLGARRGLGGAGEAGGGRLPGVGAQGGVGVGMRGRPHWADHRRRVERVGGLFAIVGR